MFRTFFFVLSGSATNKSKKLACQTWETDAQTQRHAERHARSQVSPGCSGGQMFGSLPSRKNVAMRNFHKMNNEKTKTSINGRCSTSMFDYQNVYMYSWMGLTQLKTGGPPACSYMAWSWAWSSCRICGRIACNNTIPKKDSNVGNLEICIWSTRIKPHVTAWKHISILFGGGYNVEFNFPDLAHPECVIVIHCEYSGWQENHISG